MFSTLEKEEIDEYELYQEFNKIKVDNDWINRYDVCKCTSEGTLMESINAKLICPKCHTCIVNDVMTAEDYQLNNMNNKTDLKTLRLFNTYWQPIIGAEEWEFEPNISKDNYKKFMEHLILNNYTTTNRIQMLTHDIIRKYIKDLDLPANLNLHITKILKHLGKPLPYTPPQTEIDEIFKLYVNVIGSYDKLKHKIPEICGAGKNRDNNITRPYYIYKIIEVRFPKTHKMQLLLPFIHLQHSKTLEKNDLIWEQICRDVKIQYIPTCRMG